MNSENMKEKVEQVLLESYHSLYKLAYTYVKNEEDALDIVQESAYKAIKYAGSIREEGYIKTWLWRIVINTSLDYIKKNRKECSIDAIAEKGKEDEYTDFDTIKMLDLLNDKEKTVINLRFFQEMKLEEIAMMLDSNVSTVKTLLYRSLQKLKKHINIEEKKQIPASKGGEKSEK